MAIPQGLFLLGGGGGLPNPGGAFTYRAGTVQPEYFAGTFFIDTGYDDPVAWTSGQPAAELYGARVYGASGVHSPAVGAANPAGKWLVNATPVWSSHFFELPHSNTTQQQRVYIRCDCYLSDPVGTALGDYQRLDSVAWTLYRQ